MLKPEEREDKEKISEARVLIFSNHWLDVEDIYRKQGWKVVYDSPGYDESYDAYYEFRKK